MYIWLIEINVNKQQPLKLPECLNRLVNKFICSLYDEVKKIKAKKYFTAFPKVQCHHSCIIFNKIVMKISKVRYFNNFQAYRISLRQ